MSSMGKSLNTANPFSKNHRVVTFGTMVPILPMQRNTIIVIMTTPENTPKTMLICLRSSASALLKYL